MELRNLTNTPTDYLDAYCDAQLGHTNCELLNDYERSDRIGGIPISEIHSVIVIYNEPEEEHE